MYIWESYNHLAGSTTRNIPYEMEFLLRRALSKWTNKNFIITTATSDNNHGFMCWNANVLEEIIALLPAFNKNVNNLDLLIVHVRMPSFYTRIPLYSVPMYHEIGHFVDAQNGISDRAAYESTFNNRISFAMGFGKLPSQDILIPHMSEYFSDLFSACYMGNKISAFLEHIAGGDPHSRTHPETKVRQNVINDFVTGKQNDIVDLFQQTLANLSLPQLSIEYSTPNLDTALSRIQTYKIPNDQEAHGILVSYWDKLENLSNTLSPKEFSKEFSIISDLIVKSIRNFSISEKWNDTNNP